MCSSFAHTFVRQVHGNWGSFAAPKIVSCTADGSAGSLNGYDDGDAVIIEFDSATNQADLHRATFLQLASFSHRLSGWGNGGAWINNNTAVVSVLVRCLAGRIV